MLVVGRLNGDFEFYRFTDRSHGATPCFERRYVTSYRQAGFDQRIVSITASPCGKYFVVLHDFSSGILVTKNGDNSFVFRPFLSEHDIMHIGTISVCCCTPRCRQTAKDGQTRPGPARRETWSPAPF